MDPLTLKDYSAVSAQSGQLREAALATVLSLLTEAKKGSITARRSLEDLSSARSGLIAEYQSTSEFPGLMSELMARELKVQFALQPSRWRQYIPVRGKPVTDFRKVYNVTLDRATGNTSPDTPVLEGDSFDNMKFVDSNEGYRVWKFIRGFETPVEFDWNDDLGGLAAIATLMVEQMIYAQELYACKLHAGSTGPLSSIYNNTNGNVIVSGAVTNPELDLDSLDAGLAMFESVTDPSGMPISLGGAILVVGDATLYRKALRLKNVREVRTVLGDTTIVSEPSGADFAVVYNPYLRSVVTSNLDTSWWIFPAVSNSVSRRWAEMGFFQGFEAPVLLRKKSDAEVVSGPQLPGLGSFNTWSQKMAVATIFGGTVYEDAKYSFASNGTES